MTITKFEAPTTVTPAPEVDSPDYQPPGIGQSTSPPLPKSDFPEKYGSQESSGLVAMVNADAPNTIDFDLKD